MIYLHKILPIFLLPTGITLMLVMAGLVMRRPIICWIGIAVLWLASTPFVGNAAMRAAEGWQVRQSLSATPTAQTIVVLSSERVQPPGDPAVSEWTDADRFYGGVELYKANKAPLLIFTGGWSPWQPTRRTVGEELIKHAVDLGIPRDRIMTTGKVMNTDEEARAVADLLARNLSANAPPRVLLVTSAYHMRRAQMLFARAGLETVSFPVDFQVSAVGEFTLLDLLPNAGSLKQTETALHELYGLLFYRLQF